MPWSAACFAQSWVGSCKNMIARHSPSPHLPRSPFYSFSYSYRSNIKKNHIENTRILSSSFLYFKGKWPAYRRTWQGIFHHLSLCHLLKVCWTPGTEKIYFSLYHFTGLFIYVLHLWIFADIIQAIELFQKVMVRLSWGRVYRPCYDRHAQSWLSCSCPPKLWITSYHYFW
jgi:hypothetical protein